MPERYWPLIVTAIGAVSGLASGAFGVAGGIVNKPLLRIIFRISPGSILGSPIPGQFFGALLGSFSYHRRGLINYRLVGLAAPFAFAGTILGAYATGFIPLCHLMALLVLVVLWAGERMLARSLKQFERAADNPVPVTLSRIWAVAFVAGILAGLLGLGGGFVLVPAFSILLRRDIKECIASSLAIVAVTAVPNWVIHWILGHVEWGIAFPLAMGQIAGVWFGTVFTARSSRRLVYLLFGLFLVGAALTHARLELTTALRGM